MSGTDVNRVFVTGKDKDGKAFTVSFEGPAVTSGSITVDKLVAMLEIAKKDLERGYTRI